MLIDISILCLFAINTISLDLVVVIATHQPVSFAHESVALLHGLLIVVVLEVPLAHEPISLAHESVSFAHQTVALLHQLVAFVIFVRFVFVD